MGKAHVNGDAAPLLFRQAIGVDAGKGLYQRGLAVVDVPGGADDDGLHSGQYSRAIAPGGPLGGGAPTRQPASLRLSEVGGPGLLFHVAAVRQ